MAFISNDFKDFHICVLGLGYVGLPLATVMAAVGFDVSGVEIRDNVVEALKKGEPHFFEPGLAETLKKVIKSGNINFSKFIPESHSFSVYVITVGTPLQETGNVRLDMIESVSREISRHLKDGDLVIVRSTVRIGTTRKIILPILGDSGADFDLAFCPERILEGRALYELRTLPQIVGGLTLRASMRAAQVFQFLTPTVVKVSSIENAEMVKLIDNTSRDISFALANEVAKICDVAGVDANEVIKLGKLGYPRTNLPLPGLVGGPCLEKDPYILAEGLRDFGIKPEIALVARSVNEKQPQEIVAYVAKIAKTLNNFPENPKISLMGLAFKGNPPTDDIRGSMAWPVLKFLKEYFPGADFYGYDAQVPPEKIITFGLKVCPNIEEAFKGAHLVLILNNHQVFANMQIEKMACLLARPGLIYDFWNNFGGEELSLPQETGYIALGSHCKAILPNQK